MLWLPFLLCTSDSFNWNWSVPHQLSARLRTERSLVHFSVRTHARVVGQVPSWGRARHNRSMFLSLSLSLKIINKISKIKKVDLSLSIFRYRTHAQNVYVGLRGAWKERRGEGGHNTRIPPFSLETYPTLRGSKLIDLRIFFTSYSYEVSVI